MDLWHRHREFGAQYREYRDRIFSFYYYRLDGDRAAAEDLTSDTFLRAYEAFDRYDPSVPFSAWIYAIARNRLIDHYRAKKDIAPLEEIEIADESDSLYDILDRSFDAARLTACLERLSPAQREIIRAKYFDDKSTDDIAREHSLTKESVRQHLSRGVRALRDLLAALAFAIFH